MPGLGFIVLVVCLCLIIVVSCTAIFILLRNRDPTDTERRRRRQRKLQEASKYPSSSEPWTSKLSHIFSSGKPSSSDRNGVHGWVQASSGDEWDTESLGGRSGAPKMQMSYSEHMDPPFRPPFPTADSERSVHFDSDTKMPSFPSPRSSMDNLRSNVGASPSDTPPRVSSPEGMDSDTPINDSRNGRKSSTQSSQHTFTGGTKFIESL